jgi:hypothetical protein
MTRVSPLLLALLLASASGCMAYREYWDTDADRYDEVFAAAPPAVSGQTARYTVNVVRRVDRDRVEPISKEWPDIKKLARQSIYDMGIFAKESVRTRTRRPDYHFIFDVSIESTDEPGTFSGLILPFYRSCETTVRLQVLDRDGAPFASYICSAETFQARHFSLVLFTPFYWPGWAEGRARRSVFRALAVKLITDRKEFL